MTFTDDTPQNISVTLESDSIVEGDEQLQAYFKRVSSSHGLVSNLGLSGGGILFTAFTARCRDGTARKLVVR